MLSHISATNPMGEEATLPFGWSSEGFYVYDVKGLGPTDANLVFSEYANLHGSRYESSRKRNRSIIISLGLDPDYISITPDSARQYLYRYFMTSQRVDLVFVFRDGRERHIQGHVEVFEDTRFSDDLTCKISIICPDPFFYALDLSDVPGPLTANSGMIEFEYEGNQPTGLYFEFKPTTNIGLIQITTQQSYTSKQQLEFITPLTSADTVLMSTTPGRKDVRVHRLGIDLPMLARVSPTSTWPVLYPGKNKIGFVTNVSYTGTITAQYWPAWDAI